MAQAVHAAGESSPGKGKLASHTLAIILKASGGAELDQLCTQLLEAGQDPFLFYESDPPYNGAPTALGVYVDDKELVREILGHLPLYRG